MKKSQYIKNFFPEIKGNLGFGTLRLPLKDGEINSELMKKMVDTYIANGFNYFDVAHLYMGGRCESTIRESVVERYPRDTFVLANKLTYSCFSNEEDIIPLFYSQLDLCGVDYFDFYILHAVTEARHEKYKKTNAYHIIEDLKKKEKSNILGFHFMTKQMY